MNGYVIDATMSATGSATAAQNVAGIVYPSPIGRWMSQSGISRVAPSRNIRYQSGLLPDPTTAGPDGPTTRSG